jgi:hypothetical protein
LKEEIRHFSMQYEEWRAFYDRYKHELSKEWTNLLISHFVYIDTQVERYGPYTTAYGYFTDRVTAVISGTEIRPRIQCRITVPKITRIYGPFTTLYGANDNKG